LLEALDPLLQRMACWRFLCKLLRDTSFKEARHGKASDIHDLYDLEEEDKIGEGAFSSVFVAQSRKTGIMYAVKRIKTLDETKPDARKAIDTEISLTKACDHANIVKLFEVFEKCGSTYLVMELCSGGELFDHIVECGSLTEKQAAILMGSICKILSYIHGMGICHRDLKPEHFLFQEEGPLESTALKLIDFGLSVSFSDEVLSDPVGTILYVAPEVLARAYNEACDLWSLGVIAFHLLCGAHPFDAETAKAVAKKVKTASYAFEGNAWTAISDDAKAFIKRLLEKDPKTRMTAAESLEHCWIKEEAPNCSNKELDPELISKLRKASRENHRARATCLMRAPEP